MAFNPFTPIGARILGGLSLALLLAAIGTGLWGRAQYHRAEAWEARSALEAGNHRQTKDHYRAAQAEAARLDAERIAQAEARNQEINDAVSKDHARRLAALRAEYRRLLAQARAGAVGAADGIAVPGVPPAAGGAAEAADIRLAGAAGLDTGERLTAAEQALQLDALIDWIEVHLAEGDQRDEGARSLRQSPFE